MIPEKIIITGDVAKGRNLIGFAQSHLRDLKRSMEFQGLNENFKVVRPSQNVVIECHSSFSLDTIRIHVKTKGGAHENEEHVSGSVCPEFSCYSVGFIIRESTYPDGSPIDMKTPDRRYDVHLCWRKTLYIVLLRCPTSDFSTYLVGEQVLVSSKWHTGPCCTNEPEANRYIGYNITPLACNFPRWIDGEQ